MLNQRFFRPVAGFSLLLTIILSLAALVATFLVSSSHLAYAAKTNIFLALAAGYLICSIGLYFLPRGAPAPDGDVDRSIFSDLVEGKLLALEEANEYFGAALKAADMFRLAASRIEEIVPYALCVVYLPAENSDQLRVKFATGEQADQLRGHEPDLQRSLAAAVASSGRAQLAEKLYAEKTLFPAPVLQDLSSAAAVPLLREGRVFAVLALYGKQTYDENSLALLRAIGERVAPLFASSFAFERSLSNALTDTLTNLGNERAFFLVLENQIAEAHRYRDERQLTILALDIRDFAELNKKYGHSTGDRILNFAAETIRKQLRQMDVLTRSAADEFWVVLPTAGEATAGEIVERVKRAFVVNPCEVSETEKFHLGLNFGTATFGRDGETANDLLQTALLKKKQDKSGEPGKVLWFPREYVN
jgi:diguanylate cyclase (GGDEF)-like protein